MVVVADEPKTGFDEPNVLEAPNEKREAGAVPVLGLVVAGLKENGAGADSAGLVAGGLLEKEKGTEAAGVDEIVVVLDGLEVAGLKLKVDVGVAAEDVLLLLLLPLPKKLKLGLGASAVGLVSESPDLKFRNVLVLLLVVRLDGGSNFLDAFLEFLLASNSL